MSCWRKAALLLCCTLFTHCGYTLNHRLQATFTSARGIFVPTFDNDTDEIGAERIFTNALIRELESRGEIVHESRDAAGLELRGMLKRIDYPPTAFTDPNFGGLQSYRRLPTELGVTVTLTLTLYDNATHLTKWSKEFSGFRRVLPPVDRAFDNRAPSATGLITQSIVESTYQDIAGDIMRDVYDDMVEIF